MNNVLDKFFNKSITISASYYEELLQAKIQRDMLLNIIKNTASYNMADCLKGIFNIEPKNQQADAH